jgi:uncharacterized SAM-binding protein YcdF (DUF218 family)
LGILLLTSSLVLIFGLIFFYLKKTSPYSLWVGVTFFGFVFYLLISILLVFNINSFKAIFTGVSLVFISLITVLPILSFAAFVVYGVVLQWQEDFKWINTIPIVAGVGLMIYLVGWPLLFDGRLFHVLNILFLFVLLSTIYFVLVFFFYTLTNLLNLVPFQSETIDYFVVLGAGLDGDQVTPILASRIQKGIELQKRQGAGKIIFSGGQGEDEWVSEGEAMNDYALKEGVGAEILLKETESKNTRQNIQFSKEIIDEDWNEENEPVIAIVTNNYHVLRALRQAKNLGITAIGYGSNAKFFYSLNAFFREFIAYLEMTVKIHGIMIASLGILLLGLVFFGGNIVI